MSHGLIIRSGAVVDGTGAPARTADVAVQDGLIVEVGRVDGTARCRVGDLSAGAGRLIQRSDGYVETL